MLFNSENESKEFTSYNLQDAPINGKIMRNEETKNNIKSDFLENIERVVNRKSEKVNQEKGTLDSNYSLMSNSGKNELFYHFIYNDVIMKQRN